MTDLTCPACGEHVEQVRRLGAVSLVLEPCGHQVDDRVYRDHFEES